jgi:DNA-directed RNA polymerase subunit M/transcription elongation factor TFIIS
METKKITVKKIIPEYRKNALLHLGKILYLSSSECIDIEDSIYGYSVKMANRNGHTITSRIFKNIYINKLMHIVANIDPESYVNNTYMIDKLSSKEIEPKDIISMPFRAMAPDKWAFYNNTECATISAVIVSDLSLAKTSLFTCSRCKKNECVYYQMQTRSCDEGTTNFITCLLCKKNWRQYN